MKQYFFNLPLNFIGIMLLQCKRKQTMCPQQITKRNQGKSQKQMLLNNSIIKDSSLINSRESHFQNAYTLNILNNQNIDWKTTLSDWNKDQMGHFSKLAYNQNNCNISSNNSILWQGHDPKSSFLLSRRYNKIKNLLPQSLSNKIRKEQKNFITIFGQFQIRFQVAVPKSGYFVVVDIQKVQIKEKYLYTRPQEGTNKNSRDLAFCYQMAFQDGVIIAPCGTFFSESCHQGRYVRFAICKDIQSRRQTRKRIQKLQKVIDE